MSGLYLPGFIIKRVNLTPNINIRITSLINWITEGLRKQEDALEQENNLLLRNIIQSGRFDRLQEN
jgi:hypothetical protein